MNNLRKARGDETQPQVARATGIMVPDLSRYECGRSNPTPGQMRAICDHYGVTVDKLEKLSCKKLEEYLDFSNRFCGLSVQKHGAIDSYPTLPEMGL